MNGSIFFYSLNGNGSFEWIGSMMIWLLLLLSVANVVFIIIGANENARRSQLPDRAAIDMSELISAGRYQDAIKRAAAGEDDFSRILSRGLEHAPDGVEAMTHAAEQTADDLLAARLRGLERLNVLGQVAPMIGLFGTVYGMIVAFQTIASTGGAADPAMLAGGIGTALVTTFWGLLIAIPATSAYALLRNRAIAISDQALAQVDDLLAMFRPKQDAGNK
ncbi:MAG: MotA/TolQ/ExbB proton channel family protein [Planctomycetota bacterium]|jgi:biopolymer transport protein ExbB